MKTENLEQKSLGSKIMKEAKAVGASLIPGAMSSEKYRDMIGSNKKEDTWRTIGYSFLNIAIGAWVLSQPLIYGMSALENKDINYKNWPQIMEQKVQQQKIQHQENLRNQFYNLDLNNDAVIDSTEFIYRK